MSDLYMDQRSELQTYIEEAVRRPATGFEALYVYLSNKVYVYVRGRVGGTEEALDITQEVFIDLYKSLPQFRYQSDTQTYAFVYLIAKRKLARWYKKTHHGINEQAIGFDEEMHGVSETTSHDFTSVQAALDVLDGVTKEIVILHHWSRHTFGEIAQLLSMSEAAVRVRHHRALKTLAHDLTKTSYE